MLLWRLCWLYYCYSSISSILFLLCILFISGILQVVLDHFPWQKLWEILFRVETYSDIFNPQRFVVTCINSQLRDSYTQEIQVVLKRTSIGHPCNPVDTPSSGSASDNTYVWIDLDFLNPSLDKPIGCLTTIVPSRKALENILSSTWVVG
jgi:hypothetical protein